MEVEFALLKTLLNKGFITGKEYEKALIILSEKTSDSTCYTPANPL